MNVGLIDRIVRIIAGVLLIFWAYAYPEQNFSFLGWIGIIPLATGILGWCGLYKLLGLSTLNRT